MQVNAKSSQNWLQLSLLLAHGDRYDLVERLKYEMDKTAGHLLSHATCLGLSSVELPRLFVIEQITPEELGKLGWVKSLLLLEGLAVSLILGLGVV